MTNLLVQVWKLIRGPMQWRVLWLFHSKFIVGVCGVILNDKREILLLQHRYWREGSWGLPSGYMRSKEDFEDALIREVKEETNLNVRVIRRLGFVGGYRLRIEARMLAEVHEGRLQIDGKEVANAQFFPICELPDGLLETHRRIIEELSLL